MFLVVIIWNNELCFSLSLSLIIFEKRSKLICIRSTSTGSSRQRPPLRRLFVTDELRISRDSFCVSSLSSYFFLFFLSFPFSPFPFSPMTVTMIVFGDGVYSEHSERAQLSKSAVKYRIRFDWTRGALGSEISWLQLKRRAGSSHYRAEALFRNEFDLSLLSGSLPESFHQDHNISLAKCQWVRKEKRKWKRKRKRKRKGMISFADWRSEKIVRDAPEVELRLTEQLY